MFLFEHLQWVILLLNLLAFGHFVLHFFGLVEFDFFEKRDGIVTIVGDLLFDLDILLLSMPVLLKPVLLLLLFNQRLYYFGRVDVFLLFAKPQQVVLVTPPTEHLIVPRKRVGVQAALPIQSIITIITIIHKNK